MKTNLLILMIFTTLLPSCKNEQTKATESIELPSLTFDNGKKWVANKETHDGFKAIDSIITGFQSKNNEEYVVLGEALSEQTTFIIKNCSMKGEPHDKLHIVLAPILDEISVFKENIDPSLKKTSLSKLKIYIKKYFEYFNVQ